MKSGCISLDPDGKKLTLGLPESHNIQVQVSDTGFIILKGVYTFKDIRVITLNPNLEWYVHLDFSIETCGVVKFQAIWATIIVRAIFSLLVLT